MFVVIRFVPIAYVVIAAAHIRASSLLTYYKRGNETPVTGRAARICVMHGENVRGDYSSSSVLSRASNMRSVRRIAANNSSAASVRRTCSAGDAVKMRRLRIDEVVAVGREIRFVPRQARHWWKIVTHRYPLSLATACRSRATPQSVKSVISVRCARHCRCVCVVIPQSQ